MSEATLHVALLSVEIHIPASQSLKSKRMVLKSLKDRLRSRFNVSVAEVGDWDKWQRAQFCVCMIGCDKGHLDGSLQSVLSYVRQDRSIHIIDHELEFA